MSHQKPYNLITEGSKLIKSIHLAKEETLMQQQDKVNKLTVLQLLTKHMCVEG